MKKDFALNILATVVLTAAMQLVCYPALAVVVDASEYGLLLACMGIVNTCGAAFGSALNNARLLVQKDYESMQCLGDFNIIFASFSALCLVLSFVLCLLFCSQSPLMAVAESVVSVLVLARSYLSVAFRIVIDYQKMLIMSVMGACGYLVGSGVAILTNLWVVAFFIGEICSIVYLVLKTSLLSEPFSKTSLFRKSISITMDLLLASIIANLTIYLDRFLIMPVLDAEYVSYFTVASLLGKTVGIAATPIASVLLTYYAKDVDVVSKSVVAKRFFGIVAMGVPAYLLVLLLNEPVLSLLYPTLFSASLPYCGLASLAAIVQIVGNVFQPTTLVVCSSRVQPVIQAIYLTMFITLGLGLSVGYGLWGFCIASVVANTARAIIMFAITFVFAKNGMHSAVVSANGEREE